MEEYAFKHVNPVSGSLAHHQNIVPWLLQPLAICYQNNASSMSLLCPKGRPKRGYANLDGCTHLQVRLQEGRAAQGGQNPPDLGLRVAVQRFQHVCKCARAGLRGLPPNWHKQKSASFILVWRGVISIAAPSPEIQVLNPGTPADNHQACLWTWAFLIEYIAYGPSGRLHMFTLEANERQQAIRPVARTGAPASVGGKVARHSQRPLGRQVGMQEEQRAARRMLRHRVPRKPALAVPLVAAAPRQQLFPAVFGHWGIRPPRRLAGLTSETTTLC